MGYLTSIALTTHAKKVVTDSGGLQKEAFYAGKKCLFVFDHVAWPETMVDGRNVLVSPDKEDILHKLVQPQKIDPDYQPFGDGHSAEKICAEILSMCK